MKTSAVWGAVGSFRHSQSANKELCPGAIRHNILWSSLWGLRKVKIILVCAWFSLPQSEWQLMKLVECWTCKVLNLLTGRKKEESTLRDFCDRRFPEDANKSLHVQVLSGLQFVPSVRWPKSHLTINSSTAGTLTSRKVKVNGIKEIIIFLLSIGLVTNLSLDLMRLMYWLLNPEAINHKEL